jgi:hypothetical protein
MTRIDEMLKSNVIEWQSLAPEDRAIRGTISKLRKQGIVFIPVKSDYFGFRKYIRFETATKDQRKSFAASQLKAWKTQYFNTIVPIKSEIEDANLLALMGKLE